MKAVEGIAFLVQAGTLGTWITAVLISAIVGGRKGMGGVGFFLGLLFGPFGMALVLAMVGSRMDCPFCSELVKYQAKKCPHCHSSLVAAKEPAATSVPSARGLDGQPLAT